MTAETIMTPERAYALGIPCAIVGGHANARLVWCERVTDPAVEIGDLRSYAYGDAGLLRLPARTLWHPRLDLGSKARRLWRADNGLTGKGWLDQVAAWNTAPSNSPVAAATSFNSAYPGLTFNGTNQQFTATDLTSVPTGNVATAGNASELWVVGNAVSSGSTKRVAAYGSSAAARGIYVGGTDNWGMTDGTVSASSGISGLSPAIVRVRWLSGVMSGWVNGTPFATTDQAVSSTTATSQIRFGTQLSSAANYFPGVIALVGITAALTDAEADKFRGWCAWNFGLAASLPSNDPYKNGAPTI